MDKNLSYQQARRIRKTGFSGILADQMLYEPTVAKAIGRTLSLKLQSQMMGIKERFDPLNIAKRLTFGSKIGPSLLGKMTGRSRQDIEYFTGRLKPIAVRKIGKKITPLPKEGEQLVEGQNVSIGGINKELLKIYKFLKVSTTADKKRREMSHNFDEEKQLESERRHKELLKKLSELVGKRTKTTGKANKVEVLEEESPWWTNFKSIGSLFATGLMPLLIGAFPLLAMWKVSDWAEKADINNPNGNPFAETAKAGLEFSKSVDEATGRSETLKKEQQQRNEERMTKGDPWEKKRAGSESEQLKSLAPTIQHYEKLYKEAKPADKKQIEPALVQLYDQRDALIKKISGVDVAGERIIPNTKRQPVQQTPKVDDNKSRQVSPAAVQAPQNITPTATPTPSAGNTGRLNSAITENVDAQLPKQKAEDNVTINNVVKSANKQTQKLDKLSELGVRNDEPTLLRMIMASTRVV